MPIIKKEHVEYAISKMQSFHSDLKSLYDDNGLTLLDNIGRRNILLSDPMEKFLAEAIRKDGYSVKSDGRPGEPDIYLSDLDLEIECKLTSKHSNGSINFQTDYETLKKKGELDYIYIIASKDFNEFCVLYFEKLTTEDFRSLSPGARGKVSMKKWKGMEKCTVLRGEAINITSFGKKKTLEDAKKKYINDLIAKGRNAIKERVDLVKIYRDWQDESLKNIENLTSAYQNSLSKKSRWTFKFK